MKKRLFAILLALTLALSLLPTAVFATGEDGAAEPQEQQEQQQEVKQEQPVCVCEAACTTETMNADCPVCGAEGAAAESCGKYTAPAEVEAAQPADEEQPENGAPDAEKPEGPAVQADEAGIAVQAAHTHCFCGGSVTAGDHTSHSDVTYTAWNGTSGISYSNNTAYVYLTGNATISSHLKVDGKTLYLCLNGKTLSSNGSAKIEVRNGGRLVLCDCQGGGTFKGATKNVWGGACVYLYTSTMDMFGGKLTGGKVTKGGGGGGAIALDDKNCVFNMYGGEISGNDGRNYGGAIFQNFAANKPNATGGNFNMYGGVIKNNSAKNGGAFFSTTGGTINMTGGTISGNKATQSDNNAGGGAIYMRGNGTINISGSAEITGNSSSLDGGAILMGWGSINISGSVKINNNTASRWGGAICLRRDSNQVTALYMRGGEISGNRASQEGGAVHAVDKDCLFFLYDGKITGNTSVDGGAIYLNQEPSALYMNGGEISGNTATGNGGGVYIYRSGSVCELYGGKIENNKASGNGGGIYINPSNSGLLRVGNTAVVKGNTVSGKANNVYLPSGKTLVIGIGMSTSASVGITTADTSYPVAFSNDYKNDYANYFFADDVNAHVEYKDDHKLYLVSGAVKRPLTVTFDPNGGTLADTDKTRSLMTGDTYGTLPVPSYEGHNFAGWYTEKVGGTKIEDSTTVTVFGTQTLYAHWTPVHVHAYTQRIQNDKTLKTPADCTNDAVYYLSCECGEISKTNTFTAENTSLDHDWGAWAQNSDGSTHTRTCKRDAKHTETNACSGGTATCKNKAVCTTCGQAYGELKAHDFTAKKAEDQYLKSGSSCTTKAVYYKSCTGCGLTSKGTADEATFTSGNILGHNWGEPSYTWKEVPDGYMCVASKECKRCDHDVADVATVTYAVTKAPTCENAGIGTYTAVFSAELGFPAATKEVTLSATGHKWGEATYTWTKNATGGYLCTAKRVCENDGAHIENANATVKYTVVTPAACETDGSGTYTATFTAAWAAAQTKSEAILATGHDWAAATCTAPKTCKVCNATEGDALGHNWGAWKSNGDGTHTRVCSHDKSHTENGNCSGGTADCCHKAECKVCGGKYGSLDPDNHSDLKHFPAKRATTRAEGNIEYWYCSGCGKYYRDEAATKEITQKDTVIRKRRPSGDSTTDDKTVKSVKTGDAGIALYVGMAALSLTGGTWLRRKKH